MPLTEPWTIDYPSDAPGVTWSYPPFNWEFDYRGRYLVSKRWGYGPERLLPRYDIKNRWHYPIHQQGFWVGARTSENVVTPLLDLEYLDPNAFAIPATSNLYDRYLYKINACRFLDDDLFMFLVNVQAAVTETFAATQTLARWQMNMQLGRISGLEITLGPWVALHDVPYQWVTEQSYRASHWHNHKGYLVLNHYPGGGGYQRWRLLTFEVEDGEAGPTPVGLQERPFAPNANTLGQVVFDGPRVTYCQMTPATPMG